MKKSILTVAILTAGLLVVAAPLYADRMVLTEAEVLMTSGITVGEDNKAISIKFTAQEKECYSARICFNGSAMWLITAHEDPLAEFNDKINIGLGMDVKYKFPRGSNNGAYVEVGPMAFIHPLTTAGNNNINIHAGTGIEYHRFIVSVDAYGTKSPLVMLNGGYRF